MNSTCIPKQSKQEWLKIILGSPSQPQYHKWERSRRRWLHWNPSRRAQKSASANRIWRYQPTRGANVSGTRPMRHGHATSSHKSVVPKNGNKTLYPDLSEKSGLGTLDDILDVLMFMFSYVYVYKHKCLCLSEFVLVAQFSRLALTHGGCLSPSVPAPSNPPPPPPARLFSNICSNKFNLMNGSCRLSGLAIMTMMIIMIMMVTTKMTMTT